MLFFSIDAMNNRSVNGMNCHVNGLTLLYPF